MEYGCKKGEKGGKRVKGVKKREMSEEKEGEGEGDKREKRG